MGSNVQIISTLIGSYPLDPFNLSYQHIYHNRIMNNSFIFIVLTFSWSLSSFFFPSRLILLMKNFPSTSEFPPPIFASI